MLATTSTSDNFKEPYILVLWLFSAFKAPVEAEVQKTRIKRI